MNKICGYSCEHNKSGVCQISVCDKRLIISDKTEIKQNAENNNKVVDKITYTIKPSFTTRKLKQLQKENKQLKDNWNKLKEYLKYKSERAVGEDEYVYDEIYNEMQELGQGSDSNGQ